MFEWFAIIIISAAAAMKTEKWKYRIPLGILSGLVSASIAAILLVTDDPLRKVNKIIIGGIINTVISLAIIALFAWLFKRRQG